MTSGSDRHVSGTVTAAAITTRRVATLEEYEECVAIQEETWGVGFSERVPASILLVSQQIGGVVAGAFVPDGGMLGFVFGLTGVVDGRLVHWSDMLAVRPASRGAGIGEQLKRCQRELVRAAGIETMRWTFDPLVARNAHLNLVRLGAHVAGYVPNMYGTNTGSPLHGGVPTDRFVASWDLTRSEPPVAHEPPSDAPIVNAPDEHGTPTLGSLPDLSHVRIAIPRDVYALGPEQRAAWRETTRRAFLDYLGRGYGIVGFHRGDDGQPPCYELARANGRAP
jgi:chorismate synthase